MRSRSLRSTASLALVLAWSVWAAPRTAQADVPEELVGAPIVAVVFDGEGGIGLGADDARLTIGAPLTRAALRAAARALVESGRFADLRIDVERAEGGARVRITLSPRIVVTRIEILGEGALSEVALREAAEFSVGGVVVPGTLESMSTALKRAYAEAGYPDARVVTTLRETDAPERRVLHVEVDEGEPARVARMVWDPDEPPSRVDVHAALGIGAGDVLDRRGLREGARALEARLREAGYLEARVGDVRVEVRPEDAPAEGNDATLAVPCHLGRRYRVVVDGHAPLERGDVEAVLSLADERLSRPVIDGMRERVEDVYRQHGFPSPTVRVRRTTDPEAPDDDRLAVLAVEIEPGARLRVVGVSFPGAIAFSQSFLRDQLRSYLEDELPHPTVFEPVDSDTFDRLGLSGRPATAARGVVAPREDLPDTVWHEPTYASAVEHIEELYEGAGYLAAEIGAPALTPLDDENTAIVVITVVEGPRTLLWDVGIEGEEDVAAAELLSEARLVRGEPFSAVAVEEARLRILDRYRERGHLFARVDVQTRISEDRSRAEISFEIVERFEVEVGEIRVEGAVRTDPAVILEHLRFRTGDVYRPSLAHDSEEALLSLGIFSTVRVSPDEPELAERVKPIVVTVRERTAQELALSAGVGTGEGGRASFEYSFYDLFGIAMSFTLRAQFAYQFFFQDIELEQAITSLDLVDRLERRLSATLGFPHIPGAPDLRASIDVVHLRDNFRDFGLDKNGATLSFVWGPLRRLQLTFAGEIEENIVSLFGDRELRAYVAQADIRTQRLLRVPDGESTIASARVSAAVDLRDSPFVPTDGVFASATLEFAHTVSVSGSGGLACVTPQIFVEPWTPRTFITPIPEPAPPSRTCVDAGGNVLATDPFLSSFLKLSINVSGYIEITEGWVVALQLRGGRVFHLEPGSRTYPNRAYYLGGVDTMRGFLQDQVIPQDQLDALDEAAAAGRELPASAVVRSGDFFYLLRAELRFPIVGDLQGGIFADIGNVWADADDFQASDLVRLRWTAGLGLRYATPVGPLAVDYGFNLSRRDRYEPFGALHFSIGLF